jgi:hypothetical protein
MVPSSYPLTWPPSWKRTPSHQRRRAAFHQHTQSTSLNGTPYRRKEALTIGTALERLTGELRRLIATHVVISSNLRVRGDGLPYAQQPRQLDDPGIAIYFKLKGAPRVLACDRWVSAAENIAAIAGHIAAVRAQDRYGVGTLEQAFAGYAALPAKGETQGGDWRTELGLADMPLTLDLVEARYQSLLRERHPDRGGSHDAMIRLNLARDAARAYFKEAVS